ncbi:DUF732 domain-containing protein [Mycobacterium sp. SMC-14]|uniref:DUF732 domain-containing protein n=1 Tax=Mycobacterium sp. SMC-14 TaxID=3385968 RepID=UPI00390C8937
MDLLTMRTVIQARRTLFAAAAAAAAVVIAPSWPARADDQSYLTYLTSHGFQYHVNVETPARAVQFGKNICTSLRFNGDPISRIDKKIAGAVDGVMVDAAQHELCPDTLDTP